jgi:ligand-binding sensor domain-containing protein
VRYLLVALASFITLFSYTQQYNVKSYTVEDGLSQSQVTDICQDQQGYLWVGTYSGLSRYNGIEFENYFVDDGLPDNNVRQLFVSDQGDLWVATSKGVAVFKQGEVTTFNFSKKNIINDIAELKGEIYFASTKGLVQLKDSTFIQLGDTLEQTYFLRSVVSYRDSILVCGSKKGLHIWNGDSFEPMLIPGYEDISVRSLTIKNDKLYVSARHVGLFSYDLKTGEIVNYNLGFSTVKEIEVDENSIFGMSTNSGAFLITESDTLYFNERTGLMDVGLACLFKDKEGNIWMGTQGSGLLRFYGTSIVYYTTKDGLSSDLVMSIEQDTSGGYIYGTYDRGVTLFRSNGVEYVRSHDGRISDNTVWVTFQDSLNRTWIGNSQGLSILDENSHAVTHPLQGKNPKIRTIALANNQSMLMGGDDGLIVMREDTAIMLHPELNINVLYALNGKMYCGTITDSIGLIVFDEKDNFESYERIKIPEPKINALTSDYQNNLWIGTNNGLFIMSPERQIYRFQLDDVSNPSKNKNRSKDILGLITSRDGSVWVSGMKGVYNVAYDSLDKRNYTIKNYGTAEGLIDEEANANALYEDLDGNIWVGTARGLAKIDPAASESLFQYELPVLHITGMRLFMEKFDYNDYPNELDSVFHVPTTIELPYDKNHITFDFIGINLKNPNAVKYEYRLIGVNEQWIPLSQSNYATYSSVQPGAYTFQVRATNKSKELSTIQEVNLVIHPPFWKSWWFITLMVLAGFLIIVYVFQSRISTLKQKQENEKLDLKNRLLFLEQRSLNASMNRHFIFNSLNSIQYFINSSDKLSANKFLSNFAKLIRKNLDSSAANNFIVTLQEEIERIELYLGLEKMRFSDKFEYTVDVSSSLDTESIEIPSMILQPFVENSIIHGVLSLDRKGEISVKVYKEFGEVVFEVMDNGVGIDNSLASKINQVSGDHESKGVEITNRRIEILRRLTGENLLIIGPFQMNGENDQCLGTKVILKLGGADKFND